MPAKKEKITTGWEAWESYLHEYSEALFGTMERSLKQAMDFRERSGKIMLDSAHKAQEIVNAETDRAVEIAESFQSQLKTTSEAFAKMVDDISQTE